MYQYPAFYSTTNAGPFKEVEIIISSVTITVKLEGEQKHWLLEELTLQQEANHILVEHPTEGCLQLSDPQLIKKIQKSHKLYKKRNWGIPVVYSTMLIRVLGIFVIIGFIIWFFFRSVVPWMGEKAAESFSKDYEITLGEQMFSSMKQTLKIDSIKSVELQNFYKELNYIVDYPIKLHWVDEPIVNAFAIPGGNIVIYRGIVEKMNGAEELAALIGHEVSHITLRHSLKGIFRDASNSLWWSIITGGNAGMIGILAGQTDRLQQLSYSRDLESDADKNAVVMLYNANINTKGMLDLVNLLKEEEGDSKAINFLSTHPVSDVRIEQVKQLMEEYPNKPTQEKEKLKERFKAFKQSW